MRAAAIAALVAGLHAAGPVAAAGDATTIAIAGSTTLQPLLKEAADAYAGQRPEVTITVAGGGSRPALALLSQKQIDMAASDVEPSGDDLVDHRVAIIGFAFAVNAASGVTSLTRNQLRDVLGGKVANYKQVGGNDVAVIVINRPATSGIRALIQDRIMRGRPIVDSGADEEGTSTLVSQIASTRGAIGYGTFSGLRQSGLTLVSIDGVEPTDDNVTKGRYPLFAYEHLVTNGAATREESRFLAFLETNRGLLSKYGYIPVQDMQVIPYGE